MLNIIQFIRTTEATMKRWEFHKVKSKAMAKGNSFFLHAVCICIGEHGLCCQSVCVHPLVTLVCCIETAEPINIQSLLYGGSGLVF